MQSQTLIACTFILAIVFHHIGAIQSFRILGGEFKSYRQVGDKIMAEYERLNPDGSVIRSVAHGDTKTGLRLENFEIDPEGHVFNLEPTGGRGRIQDGYRSQYNDKGQEYEAEFIPNKELPRKEEQPQPEPPKQTSSSFWDILNGIFF